MSEKKVVWILGAGFSRSLGGPLLTDLLSQTKWIELQERYPDLRQTLWGSKAAYAVYTLMAYGTHFREGWFFQRSRRPTLPGVDCWRDAEHFLDYLDAASKSEAIAKSLQQLHKDAGGGDDMPSPEHLSHTARRLLAAECSVFLKDNPPGLERWDPYVTWVESLTHSDTLITFNYDLVVETAGDHAGKPPCVLMSANPDENSDHENAQEDDRPVLVKLHGSVDWECVDGRKFRYQRSDPEYSLGAAFGTRLSICTPGSLKKTMTHDELAPLWRYAERKISEADTVIFLGYRFPPSDAEARRRLLGAIRKNAPQRADHKLILHTVLGNDASGAAAARRLSGLLEYAAEGSGRISSSIPQVQIVGGVPEATYSIFTNDLFVEDFISVYL